MKGSVFLYQTIDVKKIANLRRCKKEITALLDLPYCKNVLRFQTIAKEFISSIPHRTNDFFAWNVHSPTGFDIRYDELINEYSYIIDYYNNLVKLWDQKDSVSSETIEIKVENSEQKQSKKKTSEIKEGQLAISLRGGKRKGAGRKAIGIKKTVCISLPDEIWNEIDDLISKGEYQGYADYFRSKTGYINEKSLIDSVPFVKSLNENGDWETVYYPKLKTTTDRLKNCRKESKLTLTQLSNALGISISALNDLESGESLMDNKWLQEIAKFYNKPIEYFTCTEEI